MDSHPLPRWLALGANLAVLLGIVLLIAELNQNRDLMRAQTRHELAMGIVDLLQTPAENPQLADVMFRALAGEPLTPTELFQFQLRTNALFRYWEDVHYQYREGLYDEGEFARQRAAWGATMANAQLTRNYWCRVRALYSPEFAAEMDALLPELCQPGAFPMSVTKLQEFANGYTAAWNSGQPENVAAFFAPDGTLSVNGAASVGREAITAVAAGFMTAFPDLELLNDRLEILPDAVRYHWTFIGTNTGPGGTGQAVRFSGFEEWTFDENGLVAISLGQFNEDEYRHQLEFGVERSPE
jgi:uncharacterized protein (TIGR02246 family)